MSKFNTTTRTPNAQNLAGGAGFERTDFKKEIVSIILNSMLKKDSYYETESERFQKITNSVENNIDNAEFLMKAMVYVRIEGNFRSVSHLLACILVENVKGSTSLKPALLKIFVRPDDMTEVVSLWNKRNPNKMIPNALRKAIREALETKFNMYQFKKYSMNNKKVKLKDLVKFSRPRPQVWFDNFG